MKLRVLIALLFIKMAKADYANDVLATLKKVNLGPGQNPIFENGFQPSVELNAIFGQKQVQLGNLFRVSEVKIAPQITFNSTSPSKHYTLILADVDAPTPDNPQYADWRHWVVIGSNGDVDGKSKAVTAYLAPGPKDEYLLLLYEEPVGFNVTSSEIGGEEFVQRRSFKTAEFVKNNGLKLVGVNWFLGAGDGWKEV